MQVAKFNKITLPEGTLLGIEEMAADLFKKRAGKAAVISNFDCFRTRYLRIFTLMNCYLW